jgi:hypothetical protein
LRKRAYVYTARDIEPYGVVAEVYQPIGPGLIAARQTTEMPLDAFRQLEYALAKQLLVALDDLRSAACLDA